LFSCYLLDVRFEADLNHVSSIARLAQRVSSARWRLLAATPNGLGLGDTGARGELSWAVLAWLATSCMIRLPKVQPINGLLDGLHQHAEGVGT
jgi:hypothetical protein